jgi:hypothetical protein
MHKLDTFLNYHVGVVGGVLGYHTTLFIETSHTSQLNTPLVYTIADCPSYEPVISTADGLSAHKVESAKAPNKAARLATDPVRGCASGILFRCPNTIAMAATPAAATATSNIHEAAALLPELKTPFTPLVEELLELPPPPPLLLS